jgi:hypothetical protein
MPYKDKEKEIQRLRNNNWRRSGASPALNYNNFAFILSLQVHKCAICSREIDTSACFDHDHCTGLPRGLLCRNCNTMIGHAHENIETLQAAIEYLRKWEN